MKDAEFIYSLYVQANPVPDPDLLPLTRDEAVLLTLERSPDMTTEERLEDHQLGTPPPRRRLVAALGAAAVLVAAFAVVALVSGGDTTMLVAAVDAKPVMTFDGSVCTYEGPARIEEGIVEFSMTNSAAESVFFANIQVDEAELDEALDGFPVGTDRPAGTAEGVLRFTQASSGESLTREWPMPSGFYLLDCATGEPGATEHVWRAAHIEVVAP